MERADGFASEFSERLIDIPYVADWLATSVRHVRRLVAEKRIPYVKVGHLIRFERTDVRHWIEARKSAAKVG